MNKKIKFSIFIFIALLITCLGVSKLLGVAIADTTIAEVVYDTLGISDTLNDETSGPDNETSKTAELNQESENDKTQDLDEIPSLEPINTDSLPILEDDTDLELFMEQDMPANNAPMISVSTSKIKTPDGEEIELINNDLSLEEKKKYLSQGFSIQDIYSASELAYDYRMDSKSVLETVKVMATEQKAAGHIESASIGQAKINWEAVNKRVKKEEIKKMFNNVKDKYPEAVSEMTKQGIPAEVQLNIIMIQNFDETAKVDDLIMAYKEQGKAAIKAKIEESMRNSDQKGGGI